MRKVSLPDGRRAVGREWGTQHVFFSCWGRGLGRTLKRDKGPAPQAYAWGPALCVYLCRQLTVRLCCLMQAGKRRGYFEKKGRHLKNFPRHLF